MFTYMLKFCTYYTPRFENLQYLAVNAFPCRGMNRGLDSIYCTVTRVPYFSLMDNMRYKGRRTRVERVFAKLFRELHKVTFDKLDLILQTSSLGVPTRTANLEFIIIQTNYFRIRETGNL